MAELGGGGTPSRVSTTSSSSFTQAVSLANDRQRFTVELNPGETTFVSWKKLIKDANKSIQTAVPAVEPPPTGAHPALESRIAPGQPSEGELKDAPQSNRLSAVIEKIERLYMGKHSSDEEELGDIPDDDQYDTEDSFIDDADLDEYFEVDNSTTKHNGFFVNRGMLERVNDPVTSPNHQVKRGRKKDLKRSRGEKDDEHALNKVARLNAKMKTAARNAPSVINKSSSPSQSSATIREHYQDEKLSSQMNMPMEHSKKKPAEPNIEFELSFSSKTQNRDASVVPVEAKDSEKQMAGFAHASAADVTHQGNQNKVSYEAQSRSLLNDTNDREPSIKVRDREKNGNNELPSLNLSKSKYPMQMMKNPSMYVKEGSSVRPKGAMLERAIRELETIVAESKMTAIEVQDADNSSQAVKRRLPREVKQKLAKVARLAQSSQGKISDELIQRLMSTLGHRVQLKTLKRNLKEMVELGLSAKQEKHNRFQQIKKEVIEMIKMRPAPLKSKDSEQQDKSSTNFQGVTGSEEKGIHKGKYNMDDALEDKICDLYDLYVEGMDEYKGPQIRKLYVELAELWPNGSMDNHGIKGAVCRSKERKRALHNRHKDQEKIKRKKLSSAARTVDAFRGESSSFVQPRPIQERMVTESFQVSTSPNRISTGSTSNQHHLPVYGKMSNSSMNVPNLDLQKQEKVKVSASAFLEEARKTMDGVLLKKKVKRKSESDGINLHIRQEKPPSHQGKEKHKQQKQQQTSNLLPPSR